MTAKLISFTQPHGILPKTPLELVAFVARVSNPQNQNNLETSAKLVKYLIKHKHWSPLDMVDATLELGTTRDIARQVLRHRSFYFQEFSQRYADPTELGWQIGEPRLQDHKNRQNSLELDQDNDQHRQLWYQWENLQKNLVQQAGDVYRWAIDKGLAKEVARKVLPEGLVESRLYMKGTLRSWIHYLEVRLDASTQLEHRELAQECFEALQPVFGEVLHLARDGE